MPATSVSAVENYIRAEKPLSFSGTARKILLDQGKRKRERGGGKERKREKEKKKQDERG